MRKFAKDCLVLCVSLVSDMLGGNLMNRIMKGKKLVPLAIAAGAMGFSAQVGLTEGNGGLPFGVAQLYFELNDTDGDLGFHGLIDGDAWKSLEIEGPNDLVLLNVWARGSLRRQGMTEIFFESEEPQFSELPPAQFFKRFPQGLYDIEAITLEDEELEATIRISHVISARPGSLKVNGKVIAKNCDVTLPVVSEPVKLTWSKPTKSHPTVGTPNVNVSVQQYQVIGEIAREGQTPDLLIFAVDLPAGATSFEFPEDFTGMADGEMKFEIVTKLRNGNQTAVESCVEIT